MRLLAKSAFLTPSLLPTGAKLSFYDFAKAVSCNNAFAPRMNGSADEDRRSQSGVNLQRGAAPALFHHRDGAGDNDDRIKCQASHNHAPGLRDP